MKPFVGDHTIETILFTIGGDFSGLHPPSDKTNRFIFIGTGSGDYDAAAEAALLPAVEKRRLQSRQASWKKSAAM